MRKFVTITSINGPHPRLREFVDLGYEVVVAGDSKSDEQLWRNVPTGVTFLTLREQEDINPELHTALGTRTYARKNFAYLYAMENGADVIWETDDDTFTRGSVGDPLDYLAGVTSRTPAGARFWNPYSHFAVGLGLWPRGYPLSRIYPDRFTSPALDDAHAEDWRGVVQCLVSGEPDLDAIYRLTHGFSDIQVDPAPHLVEVDAGTWVPGNTQATLWNNPRVFEYVYVPAFVPMRWCDILKMYVAQSQLPMYYAGFLMEQVRNPHDLVSDFKDERTVYESVEPLTDVLAEQGRKRLSEVYAALATVGMSSEEEVAAAAIFERHVDACSGR